MTTRYYNKSLLDNTFFEVDEDYFISLANARGTSKEYKQPNKLLIKDIRTGEVIAYREKVKA